MEERILVLFFLLLFRNLYKGTQKYHDKMLTALSTKGRTQDLHNRKYKCQQLKHIWFDVFRVAAVDRTITSCVIINFGINPEQIRK